MESCGHHRGVYRRKQFEEILHCCHEKLFLFFGMNRNENLCIMIKKFFSFRWLFALCYRNSCWLYMVKAKPENDSKGNGNFVGFFLRCICLALCKFMLPHSIQPPPLHVFSPERDYFSSLEIRRNAVKFARVEKERLEIGFFFYFIKGKVFFLVLHVLCSVFVHNSIT